MDKPDINPEPPNSQISTFREHQTRQVSLPGIHPWLSGGLCLITAFLFLLIASKSSPLYPLNDWTDANTFLTVGKGMVEGLVPYRDLFEQKGPLLYLIFGLGSLISRTTFLGAFLLEVLSLAVFLFYSQRLMALFMDDPYALLGLPLLAAAVLNLRSFGHGGSAEQFVLPFIAISLYYYVRYFKQVAPEAMPPNWLILNGILAGCVLWIKYSFSVYWIGWIGAILLSLLVKKQFIPALKNTAYFLGGMLSATLPWVLYFGVQRAIGDWLEAYFIINLTAYPMDLTLRERIMVPIDSLQRHLALNPAAVSLLLFGTIVFTTNKKYLKDIYSRLGLLVSLAFLVLGVYGGGRDYIYYFFIFAAFIVLGVIVLVGLYADEYGPLKSRLVFSLLLIIGLAGSLGYTLRYQRNTYMLSWQREEMVQFRFAALIQQTPDPSLLNYGFQDSGFYTVAGITPNVRFFQQYNIDYASFPLPTDEQNRYLKEGLVDFVVLRALPGDDTERLPIPHLYENYQLITIQPQLFGDTPFNYLLFRRFK